MSTDIKKHQSFAAGEKPTRAALASAILSINDAIPVANATEATQVAVAIANAGQNLATTPVVVTRADARGLHRVEITYDPNGIVWVPASGVLTFVTIEDANAWATANTTLLTPGDEAIIASVKYMWTGTAWMGGTITLTNFSSAWSATGGYAPTLVRKGKTRTIYGAASRGSGGSLSSILVLPAEDRPANNTFLPGNATGAGVAYALGVQPNGVLWVPYGGGTSVGVYPLAGSWEVP